MKRQKGEREQVGLGPALIAIGFLLAAMAPALVDLLGLR